MRIKNIQRIPIFFSEVKKEIRKVTWPTKKQALINTLIVIGVSVVVGVYLGGLDAIFTWITGKIIK